MDTESCEFCGSADFYLENGVTYCGNGHDQNKGPLVASDDEDYGTQGKRVRNKERLARPKVSKIYRGKKGYRLFLQAYQLVVWKQCYAMIRKKGIPADLWTIVRDLWTLRLSKLMDRLEDPNVDQDGASQVVSSGPDSQDESSREYLDRTKRKIDNSPTLLETICLCYMGILLMRLPIRLSQIYRWIMDEDVPYIRAIRYVPAEMKDKLPGEYYEALDTSVIPNADILRVAVSNLCGTYGRSYGMSIPPLNWSLFLFDYIKQLALPLEVYAAAKSLNQILKFDFSYTGSSHKRRNAIFYPEAQLMSLVVIVVKLQYPLRGGAMEPISRSGTEPGAHQIDWTVWANGRSHSMDCEPEALIPGTGPSMNSKDIDILNMSHEQLDAYMDWYQRMWVTHEVSAEDVNKEILEMFPLKRLQDVFPDPSRESVEEISLLYRVEKIQQATKSRRGVPDEDENEPQRGMVRPGMHYQQFRDYKALTATPAAESFHKAAAETACLSLETLLRAILQAEQTITLWRRAKLRAETFGEEMDVAAEGALPPGLEGIDRLNLSSTATGREEGQQEHLDGSDSSDSMMRMIE